MGSTDSGYAALNVEGRERKQGVKFDNTINLGHVLTFLGFLLTIMVTWTTLDKRVVVLEEGRKAQAMLATAQEIRTTEKFFEITDTLREIRREVKETNTRLERKP